MNISPSSAEQRSGESTPKPQKPASNAPRAPQGDDAGPAERAQPPAHDGAAAMNTPIGEPPALPASSEPSEPPEPPERQNSSNGRGRLPFAAASRGSHAYIPASGLRPGLNGHYGANGQNGQNGRFSGELRLESSASASDLSGEDGAGLVPQNWRVERLNGGVDTTPREPARPESRGEVGALIDALHDLFAQDRAVATRGDSARCGICYLHFPVSELEYREAEGFYVCSGCRRSLGHQPLMMIRRQQAPHGG